MYMPTVVALAKIHPCVANALRAKLGQTNHVPAQSLFLKRY